MPYSRQQSTTHKILPPQSIVILPTPILYQRVWTKHAPMSSRLSKRKSAPALLFRLSPLPETDYEFQLVRNRITCLRNSQSAPSLATSTNESHLSREMLAENSLCGKKDYKVIICAGSRGMVDPPTDQSFINPAQKASPDIGNSSQQTLVDTTPYPTGGEPLREFVPASFSPWTFELTLEF